MGDDPGQDQRGTGEHPAVGRRGEDRISLREFFEHEIARVEATMALEMSHLRREVSDAQAEFRLGISDLRSDLTAITATISSGTSALQTSIADLALKVNNNAVTWKAIFRVFGVCAALITFISTVLGIVLVVEHLLQHT